MTSARFEELERRAKRYKTKKSKKLIAVVVVMAFIGLFSSNYMINNQKEFEQVVVEKEIEPKPIVQPEIVEEEKKESVVHEPIVVQPPMDKVKEEEVVYDVVELKPIINLDVPVQEIKEKKVKEPKKEKQKIVLHVKEVTSEAALLERFKVVGDYESAFALAEHFLEQKSFDKAIFWSKKASKLKPSADKPWIVFAKAKFEQNKKDEAIKALELFLDYFASDEAQKLLESYKR